MMLAIEAAGNDQLLTMVTAIAAGCLLVVVARRLHIPTIVVLLVGGVSLGPAGLGLIQPDSLGDGLRVVVSMAVGLILFEGGLTLDVTGYKSAPGMIKRLLTLGVFITWFGTAGLIYLIVEDISLPYSIMAASLVIVTGPTVIAPLLKRVKVTSRLHNILHWEGVLIDPIGVFIAILCFEWISSGSGQTALANLGLRVLAGLLVGGTGGVTLWFLVRRRVVNEETINVFALGFAVLVFGVAEAIAEEAGLLAVTIAGFIFGLVGSTRLKQIKQFKADITDLLIGLLFMLLAARLQLEQFVEFGWRGAIVVAAVMFVVRPLSIFVCATKLDLTLRDKALLSWIAPRGIVAASMASLVALRLTDTSPEFASSARFVETFTYSVIIATILIQGTSAGWVARALGVRRPPPTGWLIVGAHALGRKLAEFIKERAHRTVVLVDTNPRHIRDAKAQGIQAIATDARDTALAEQMELLGIGNVLALTDNEDLNVRICQIWAGIVGAGRVYRCDPTGGMRSDTGEQEPGTGVVVWPGLPRPTILSAEIERSEALVIERTGAKAAQAQAGIRLLSFRKNALSFTTMSSDDDSDDSELQTLFLQRRGDHLSRCIHHDLIRNVDARTLEELFTNLVTLAASVFPTLPIEGTIRELLEREASFPTGLGHGVAVPHAYMSSLDRRCCVVAHVPDGVNFESPDDEPVTIVFLLLSPQGDPDGHLATLAEIARLVRSESTRSQLRENFTPEQVEQLIRKSGSAQQG